MHVKHYFESQSKNQPMKNSKESCYDKRNRQAKDKEQEIDTQRFTWFINNMLTKYVYEQMRKRIIFLEKKSNKYKCKYVSMRLQSLY